MEKPKKTPPKKPGSIWSEVIIPILIAAVIVYLIRAFIIGMYFIPSGSMIPTLLIDDHVVVTKLSYQFNDPVRGDVVVFDYPPNDEAASKTEYVKRVVGLPNETLEIKNNTVYINDQPLEEPYLPSGVRMADFGPVAIPNGHYFVMGDNRNNSNDSRYWGTVAEKYIIGKAQAIYWPIDRMRVLS